MKCQIIFSGENTKNITKCRLLIFFFFFFFFFFLNLLYACLLSIDIKLICNGTTKRKINFVKLSTYYFFHYKAYN